MKKLMRWWSVASAIAILATPAMAAQGDTAFVPEGIARLKAATGGRAQISVRRGTGAAQFVRIDSASNASLAPSSAREASPADKVQAFFAEHGAAFGIRNAQAELQIVGQETDAIGFQHVRYQQVYNGIPVFGAQLKGHVNAEGELVAVNGTGVPGISVDTRPTRTAEAAGKSALEQVTAEKGDARNVTVRSSRLVVFREGLVQGVEGADHLAYEVEVGNGADVREFVYLDAHTGKKIDQITGVHDAMNRVAYDGAGSTQNPPQNWIDDVRFWQEGDPFPTPNAEANNMITASGETYAAFMKTVGRDSFDANGGTMEAIFNRGYQCPNASWNGLFISFCPGITTDDVTAHEWGHAYTQYTHGLIYQWQSGAINEAYSDIYGEAIDLINGRDTAPYTNNGLRTAGACSTQTPLPASLIVNAPAAIAGSKQAGSANGFGPQTFNLTGDLVLANDGVAGGTISDGCCAGPSFVCAPNSWPNAAQIAGKIAVVDRGLCGFAVKAKNAQDNGAIGIVVANNAAGIGNMGGVDATVTIPALFILQTDGNAIKSQLAVPTTVNATMARGQFGTDPSVRWLMGEDSTAPGLVGALRDMFNPNCFSHPGKVSDGQYYICTTFDNGGVHINSGIPNKMFTLLVDGGTYNTRTVASIGLNKAFHLYYRASLYQVPTTDFAEHADAMQQACSDLTGLPLNDLTTGLPGPAMTAANCASVANAILAVELRTPPTFCNFQPLLAKTPPTNVCGFGGNPVPVFNETFEGDVSAWTRTNAGVFPEWNGGDWYTSAGLPGNRAGTAFFSKNDNLAGSCNPGDDQSGVRYLDSPAIALPAGVSTPRVSFEHYVALERNYDGGNVKVSVNGGAWQDTNASQFTYNAYNLGLFTAAQGNTDPLAGQQAYSGADGGSNSGSWGRSILNLTGLAAGGDSIRLRFAMGQDGCGGVIGWYVDDVKVSICPTTGISIDDVTVTEGNSGTTDATFTISLSAASSTSVQVTVNTANGTAIAPGDYTAIVSQNVTFTPGQTSKTVTVPVIGETDQEGNETFFVNLSAAINGLITDAQGIGTITDDDTPPTRGDFNGDHKADLVWRDQGGSGSVAVWTMDGVNKTGGALVTPAPMPGLSWEIQGVGDFNGDGKPDLVWRDQGGSGHVAIWTMNGTAKIQGYLVTTAPVNAPALSWRIAGTGDFNNDGNTDLVWRDQGATGNVAIWYMNGTARDTAVLVNGGGPYPALTWQIQGVGDFNGDGGADLVWRDQGGSGHIAIWTMLGANKDNAFLVTTPPVTAPALSWQIQAVGDYNGDLQDDLVFRDQGASGTVAVWFMTGTTKTSSALVTAPSTPALSWRIVGPR